MPDPAIFEKKIFEEAGPLAQRIVGWRLGGSTSPQDREDVVGDVLVDLLSRLDLVRRGESEPILDFAAYTAVAAHHGCDRYLRRRFPQRFRLGTRVRYLLENTPGYAIWQESGGQVCGPATRRGQSPRTDLVPGWTSQVSLPPRANEPRAVAQIFAFLEAPIRLSDLVDAVAVLLNIRDQPVPVADVEIAARTEDRDLQLQHRQTLVELWREIELLPLPQRIALLLNLRDEDGLCALTSLPATGVASMREIAGVMEMPAEELAQLWPRLPVSDLEIAARLGLSRQQIINLRKAARQRLGRRMAGNMDPKPDSKRKSLEI
jgi:hypothetical protein